MGTTWGRQDPGGPHVGPMDLAIWELTGTDFMIGKSYMMRRLDEIIQDHYGTIRTIHHIGGHLKWDWKHQHPWPSASFCVLLGTWWHEGAPVEGPRCYWSLPEIGMPSIRMGRLSPEVRSEIIGNCLCYPDVLRWKCYTYTLSIQVIVITFESLKWMSVSWSTKLTV